MWPLRSAFGSWRRANPDGEWKNSLEEIIKGTEQKKPIAQNIRAVKFVLDRLKLISSGHANCPVPKSIDELIVWWSVEPPK